MEGPSLTLPAREIAQRGIVVLNGKQVKRKTEAGVFLSRFGHVRGLTCQGTFPSPTRGRISDLFPPPQGGREWKNFLEG